MFSSNVDADSADCVVVVSGRLYNVLVILAGTYAPSWDDK